MQNQHIWPAMNRYFAIAEAMIIGVLLLYIGYSHRSIPVVTDPAMLLENVGRMISIEGVQLRTKVPTVLGVEVGSDDSLSGHTVRATGILMRFEIDEGDTPFTERSAGVHFVIYDPNNTQPARAAVVAK